MAQDTTVVKALAPLSDGKPPLEMGVRVRLSLLMFLQFAVWGAWFSVYNVYLGKPTAAGGLGFDARQMGCIYGNMAFGAMISTMFAGQLADALLSTEHLLAIFHLIGAALMFMLARAHDYNSAWWISLAYSLTYNPTLALANSLAFANVKDATRDFPTLRVLGTIGWIAVGLAVSFVLPAGAQGTNKPLYLSAGISVVLGLYSFLLPHTPPTGKSSGMFPFVRAFKLLLDPKFGLFFGVSLFITIALTFYFAFAGPFLDSKGVKNVAAVMTIGQWSEIGFMLLLPFALRWLGMKGVLLIGMSAWALRYFAFSVGTPFVLILVGLALHGVCFDFFLAAGFIHTENKAPIAIRSSAQALYTFLNYGLGMWLGNIAAGYLVQACTDSTHTVHWSRVWLVPAIAAAAAVPLFALFWNDREGKLDDAAEKQLEGDVNTVTPLIE